MQNYVHGIDGGWRDGDRYTVLPGVTRLNLTRDFNFSFFVF